MGFQTCKRWNPKCKKRPGKNTQSIQTCKRAKILSMIILKIQSEGREAAGAGRQVHGGCRRPALEARGGGPRGAFFLARAKSCSEAGRRFLAASVRSSGWRPARRFLGRVYPAQAVKIGGFLKNIWPPPLILSLKI